jgi:hypothetical protein
MQCRVTIRQPLKVLPYTYCQSTVFLPWKGSYWPCARYFISIHFIPSCNSVCYASVLWACKPCQAYECLLQDTSHNAEIRHAAIHSKGESAIMNQFPRCCHQDSNCQICRRLLPGQTPRYACNKITESCARTAIHADEAAEEENTTCSGSVLLL